MWRRVWVPKKPASSTSVMKPSAARAWNPRPAAGVLFRPEEVHAGSEELRLPPRRAEAIIQMTDDLGRVEPGDPAVAHLDRHGVAAVEAGGVDPHRLARKEPGDGGRLEAALREPSLLAARADPILRRQVVERRERGDVVRLGMEPADRIGLHHVVEDEAALVGRQPEGARELGIVRRATRFDETTHDALEHPVHEARLGHPTGFIARPRRPSAAGYNHPSP